MRKANVKVSPKLLIEHDANNGRFKEKAIYNELSAMRSRGLLATVKSYGETLTLFGRKELERMNVVGWAVGMKKPPDCGKKNRPEGRLENLRIDPSLKFD